MVSLAILLPVLSASTGATYNVLTRIAARYDGNVTLALLRGLGRLPGLEFVFMPFLWQAPTSHAMAAAGGLGSCGGFAHTLVIRAFTYASASIIAPFIYLQLLWATAIGYGWFDMLPAITTWIGGAVIIAPASIPRTANIDDARERLAKLDART